MSLGTGSIQLEKTDGAAVWGGDVAFQGSPVLVLKLAHLLPAVFSTKSRRVCHVVHLHKGHGLVGGLTEKQVEPVEGVIVMALISPGKGRMQP